MNYKKKPISTIVSTTLVLMSMNSMADGSISSQIEAYTDSGKPSFMTGSLGSVNKGEVSTALKAVLASEQSFNFSGNEDFVESRSWTDELGKMHTHFDQTINGIKVYGTSLIVHTNITQSSLSGKQNSGNIYAISGNLAVDNNPNSPALIQSLKSSKFSKREAATMAKSIGKISKPAELVYIYLPLLEKTSLAWRMEVSWHNGPGDFGRDFVYYDAETSELLTRDAQVHSAKSWRTYTLNGGSSNSAPGSLLCTNNQSCGGNAAAQRAHDGASKVYDYYQSKHGRDSLDNNGMALVSSVDLGEQNAYWTGSQMLYGAASSGLNDFTSDFDIIGHEFTHGVTDKTAGLVYRNASGALNEAWSDILGLSAEAFKNGTTTSTWLLGDGLYNNQPGKAFRYMNNPTQDNYSKDYWPERIPYVNNPNNSNDYGGVHGNSGIANLAYVLLVDGGTHPRNKTTANVPSIGMAKAEKIFYRALTTYFNQSTNFAAARSGTAQAAQDLYGATEKNAVETAWCAVGVGTCPGGTPPPPPPPGGSNELQNNVAKTGLSASTGNDITFTMDVPSGATGISFTTSGGSGDADMYVKFGSAPTDSSYDCRPYKNGNAETCSGTSTGGKYYVRLKAYSTFSGVSLTGKYTGGGTPPPPPPPPTGPTPIDSSVNNISVNRGAWKQYNQVLGAGYSTMTISISGGSGDADLYVRNGAQPTSTQYNCRPYKNGNNETCTFSAPAQGTWYIGLYGYSAASGVTLKVTAN